MDKNLKTTAGDYADLLHNLKERIRAAQVRASLSVNRELVLLYWQIGRDILSRQEAQGWGSKVIDRTLPHPQSDLAHQVLKDPYTFDFLSLGREDRERDLERGLIDHLRAFLLELGVGFAFVGRQVHLERST